MRKLFFVSALLLLIAGGAKASPFDFRAPAFAAQSGGGPTLPTYFYVVVTQDVNGLLSANSNEASATLKQGMTKGVSLTWVAPVVGTGQAAIAGYNVMRATVSGGPYKQVNASLVTGGTSFTDPFVSPSAGTLSAPTVN